eukprot:GHVO01027454.1.p1 GENE.GHVO01027454.1~~GHVO01027454.1.p1  ORF type:complete len:230 (-),score=32.37 GHVO01027454.1:178-867(-)
MTVRIEMLPPVGCKGEWGYSNLTYAIRIINWKDATRSKCVSGSHVFSTEEPTVSYRPFDQITEFDELKYFLGPNNELVIRAAVKSPPFIPRHEYKIRWTLPDFLSLPDGQRFYSMIGWKEQLSFRIVLYPEDLGVYINAFPTVGHEGDEWEYEDVRFRIGIVNWNNEGGSKYLFGSYTFSSKNPEVGFEPFMERDKLKHFLGPSNQLQLTADLWRICEQSKKPEVFHNT